MLFRLPLPSHFFFPRFGPATGRHFFGNDELTVWNWRIFWCYPRICFLICFPLKLFVEIKHWQHFWFQNGGNDFRGKMTLQGTNISHQKWHFEDDFPFPQVGYVSSLEGIPWSLTTIYPFCGPSLSPPAAARATAWTMKTTLEAIDSPSLLVLDFTSL